MKKIIIISVATLCMIGLIFLSPKAIQKNIDLNDLTEIKDNIKGYDIEFKSERGFGNDRWDVYSFSLEEPLEYSHWEKIDKSYYSIRSYFYDNSSDDKWDMIIQNIYKLEKDTNTRYSYVDLDGTKKLYLYNPEKNKGYCVIITI
ncbi:hypothetical protein [Halolactibacillus halophilus]|uniref:Uncharacterized protein n=2 Tax=Halolactibacillus halophilus TaxID=306540 RepID=A0ABQ0VK31_9BACI|nr:hypothetical protein [Halolactibacillus halophilus]GEM01465.1 hypothetical protein HHA03_09970 [Halolactibacillus halophilus]